MFFRLAQKSLWHRKGAVVLTLLAMSISVFALLGVNHLREQAKTSFAHTISGVDLIVGAPTSQINLLLSTVFQLGNVTRSVPWSTYQSMANQSGVAWAIPLALGDSHKGFRVVGTTSDYVRYYRYGQKHPLEMRQGRFFQANMEVVLGAAVAQRLHHRIGDAIILSHGVGHTSFQHHDQDPFTVVGILEPTGTPVDQTLYVNLASLASIHGEHESTSESEKNHKAHHEEHAHEAHSHAEHHGHEEEHSDHEDEHHDHEEEHRDHEESHGYKEHHDEAESSSHPKQVSAFFLGLKSKRDAFRLQAQLHQNGPEPLMAIMPGVALMELWQVVGTLEHILSAVANLVLLAALFGLGAVLLASIRERHQEISLLRIVGASPWFLVGLIQCEALIISVMSVLLGSGILAVVLVSAQPYFSASYGVTLSTHLLTSGNMQLIGVVLIATIIAASIPSLLMYRRALTYR